MIRKKFLNLFLAFLALALSWKTTMFCDVSDGCQAVLAELGVTFDYHLFTYAAFGLFCLDLFLLFRAIKKAAA